MPHSNQAGHTSTPELSHGSWGLAYHEQRALELKDITRFLASSSGGAAGSDEKSTISAHDRTYCGAPQVWRSRALLDGRLDLLEICMHQ